MSEEEKPAKKEGFFKKLRREHAEKSAEKKALNEEAKVAETEEYRKAYIASRKQAARAKGRREGAKGGGTLSRVGEFATKHVGALSEPMSAKDLGFDFGAPKGSGFGFDTKGLESSLGMGKAPKSSELLGIGAPRKRSRKKDPYADFGF